MADNKQKYKMEDNDYNTIAFPKQIAKAIVKKVNMNVKSMLRGSKVIDKELKDKNDSFGFFEKSDLKLGKLLGSGGFSDVYEICKFNSIESNRTWTYQQSLAREVYRDNAVDRNGKTKYVAKHLKLKMLEDAEKFSLAASDLVVEAQFLSSLKHENILKIRGWAAAGIESFSDGCHDSFFLILDRLDDTLDSKLKKWKTEDTLVRNFERLNVTESGNFSNRLLHRIKIAHQIASALEYLHQKNIVFRDLKPDNVGFDQSGTVKIFDFGLARELPKECENVNDVYHMSGVIGTLRYMAPEVALSKHYNQKVDTYSWATVFWYCLSLTKPYETMNRKMYLTNVCKLGHRPSLNDNWPKSIRNLLRKSWAQDPCARITMLEVCAYLERIEAEMGAEIDMISPEAKRSSFHAPGRRQSFVPSLLRQASNSYVPFVV